MLAAEVPRPELVQQAVVGGAAMQGQRDGSFLAIRHRLAGRLLGGQGHERDLTRPGRPAVGTVEERRIDFLDRPEDGFGLKRRAGQTGDQGLPQLSIQRLSIQSFEVVLARYAARPSSGLLALQPAFYNRRFAI